MIVESLSFNKQQFKLCSLPTVQSFPNDLAFEDFTDLILTTRCCCKTSRFDCGFLSIRTD